jgi:urease subunit alpha
MAAEGPLHDFGAISITNSDSQGVGRIAETIRRTWQLADAMKRWRTHEGSSWAQHGGVAEDLLDDNARILRYLAKYTIEPALVHGISHDVGTLTPGHLADIVLWRPGLFGVKPEMVLKNGVEAWGAMGDGNGSVERIQPVTYGGHWATTGTAGAAVGTTFVSRAALEGGLGDLLGTRRRLSAVSGTRNLTRADLFANRAVPPVEIDPRTGEVFLHGSLLASEPVSSVPMNRAYLLS